MKVLLVGAGNSIHLQRWANGLVHAGCDVACATVHASLPEGWDPRVALHTLWPRGGAGYLLALPALRRLARQGRFDLVHAHYATGYGFMATLAAARPLLVSVWGSDVDDFPKRSPMHAGFLRGVLSRADALAATSRALERRVQEIMAQPVPVFITPFGVDVQAFVPPAGGVGDPERLLIGSSKGLASTYGIDTLLRAFAALPERAPDGRPLHLRLLGDGPQAGAYRALADGLGLQQRVQFVGAIAHDQMPQALQSLDIFVAPSRRESFGVSVLEASACERPVVASDVGGLPEVVQHGVTGLLVPANDVPALTAALQRLVNDPPLRRAMGAAGRRMVVERFAWDRCVGTMLSVYEQVLRRPGLPATSSPGHRP